jgi:hypothetical protein
MKKIEFITEAQQNFFQEHREAAEACGNDSAALIYVLGISETCRDHFPELYDEKEHSIHPEALRAGWQTDASTKLTRIAFSLFTWTITPGDDPKRYTPKELYAGLNADEKKAAAQALIYFA